MNKKTLILSCLALLGLTSCGGQGGDDPTDSLTTDSEGNVVFNDVNLRVWSVIGDPDRAYLEMVNSSFNDLYADRGIQATITPIVNGDYYTQLANVINTDPDNAPDVIIFHSERLTKLAHDNIIVPMEEYFDLAKSPFDENDYLSNVMAECRYEDKIYGVPLDVHAGVWYVRSDILEKNGLSKPSSLSEWIDVCNALIKLNNEGKLWHRAMDATKPAAGDWVQSRLPNFYPIVMSDTGGIENGWIPQTAVFQNGGEMTTAAFAQIPVLGPVILVFGIITFAYSTILGWAYYGERCVEYFAGKKGLIPYRILYVAVALIAPVLALDLVWLIADILNALMAIPNLIAVLLLSSVIVSETKKYINNLDAVDDTPVPVIKTGVKGKKK